MFDAPLAVIHGRRRCYAQPKCLRASHSHVLRIASANPKVRAELRRYPRAKPYTYTRYYEKLRAEIMQDSCVDEE